MIDEKKLIEEIVKRIGVFSEMQIDFLEFLINKQPKVGEWIPCSERLPKEDVKCLVSVNVDTGYDVEPTIETGVVICGNWCFDNEFFDYTSLEYEVIAWQPLPQPYKGE